MRIALAVIAGTPCLHTTVCRYAVGIAIEQVLIGPLGGQMRKEGLSIRSAPAIRGHSMVACLLLLA